MEIDVAFTELARDGDGRAIARLAGPDGRTVELWADHRYEVIEVYTGDALAPTRRRKGLAVEPMSCPPNGLASGEGIVTLAPGQEHTASWGARLR